MLRSTVKLLTVIILIHYTSAHILIDIEPDELQRLGEILVETYLEQNTILRSGRMASISRCKKIAQSAAQLIGIMFSLVGANLLTNALQPLSNTPMDENIEAFTQPTAFIPSKICKHEFGCDHGVCWRSCEDESSNSESWCYTSAPNETAQFHSCKHTLDCSPCWKCGGVCNSKQE